MQPEDLEPAEANEENDLDVDPAKRIRVSHHATTFTHCEIRPSMILGVAASIIPFPDYNQSSVTLTNL
ncbi:DNA-dependent RNA polymerase II [Fusarium falciforme]|nr:DNA-dependent RNA polymerase II [Fusarium falciforme]